MLRSPFTRRSVYHGGCVNDAAVLPWVLLVAAQAASVSGPVDLHCHFSMVHAARPVFRGEPGRGPLASRPDEILANQVDVRGLRAAGLRLLVATVWPPFNLRPGVTAREEALRQLEELRALARRSPELRLAGSAQEARALLARPDAVVLLPGVEGAEGIERVEDVDVYFAAGARVLTLMHLADSGLGGAAQGQVGAAFGLSARGSNPRGLSPLGREVVKRMIALGMVVDVAHASERAVQEVLALTEAAKVPVINSHTGARALTDVERNGGDAEVARIARGGGLVGVTLFRKLLREVPAGSRLAPHVAESCDDLVAHWRHLAGVAGKEAVVLGSDFNGMVVRPRPGGRCPNGVATTGDLPALFGALEAEGLGQADGAERFLSLLERVEAKASPALRAAAAQVSVPRAEPLRALP